MSRTTDVNRDFSLRKSKRKEYIAKHIFGFDWYDNLHQYSKNKIHCSCPCCSAKTNTSKYKSRGPVDQNRHNNMNISGTSYKNWKFSDLRQNEAMDYQEEMYENDCF